MDNNLTDLTQEGFQEFAKAFFLAFPQIEAITLSNFFHNKRTPFFFTFWKNSNFHREIKDENLWQYFSNENEENIFKHCNISHFGFLAKTKGVYVMKREEFNLSNKSYTIENYLVFMLKFGGFFRSMKCYSVAYTRQGFFLKMHNGKEICFSSLGSGHVIRKRNNDFSLDSVTYRQLGSLFINTLKEKAK